MPLHVVFQDDELAGLIKLLDRAGNTLDVKDAPHWLWDLDNRAKAALARVTGTVAILTHTPQCLSRDPRIDCICGVSDYYKARQEEAESGGKVEQVLKP